MPKNVLDGIEVHLVDHVDEVLKLALVPPDMPPAQVAADGTADAMGTVPDGLTH